MDKQTTVPPTLTEAIEKRPKMHNLVNGISFIPIRDMKIKSKNLFSKEFKASDFEDRIFEIIVPVRNTIKVSQGKKETVKEKIFPGYV